MTKHLINNNPMIFVEGTEATVKKIKLNIGPLAQMLMGAMETLLTSIIIIS